MIAPFLADNIMPQEMRNHAYYCLEMDKTFDDTFFLDEEV